MDKRFGIVLTHKMPILNGNYCPENCEFITSAENLAIGKRRQFSTNSSGYTGVSPCGSKWRADIRLGRKNKYLGQFINIDDAVRVRIKAEVEAFGVQKTNFHFND